MEVGWCLQHKKFKNWFLTPTLGVYSENNYSYTRYYIYGIINTDVDGTFKLNDGRVVFTSPEAEQAYLMSHMDQVNKKVELYPCYGLMLSYIHNDMTFFLKANNKQCSVGFGFFVH